MDRQSFIIGRAGDITLYDDTVSRRHACLEIEDGQVFLQDLDSRNGTYELRDKKLVPFRSGAVYAEQVFAFGECVRSIRQLLKQAGVGGDELESTAGGSSAEDDGEGEDEDVLDATRVGFSVAPRKRLSRADILGMLDRVEDRLAAGEVLETVCTDLGITEQRYGRWCEEYGATRAERDESTALLRSENERLRRLISDLMLERESLREALRAHGVEVPGEVSPAEGTPDPARTPNFTVVGNDKPS